MTIIYGLRMNHRGAVQSVVYVMQFRYVQSCHKGYVLYDVVQSIKCQQKLLSMKLVQSYVCLSLLILVL